MSKIYFTLTGTKHYFGKEFLKKGMKLRLEKEQDNEYDKEAIKVTFEGIGKIGYVANSSYTVLGDSMSAGRIVFWRTRRNLRNQKRKLLNKKI